MFWEKIPTDFVYFQKNEKPQSIYRTVIQKIKFERFFFF
jgi:hypothetical protein